VHNEGGAKRVVVTKGLPGTRWLDILTAAGCRVEVCTSPDIILSNAAIKQLLGDKCDGVIGQLTEVRWWCVFARLACVCMCACTTVLALACAMRSLQALCVPRAPGHAADGPPPTPHPLPRCACGCHARAPTHRGHTAHHTQTRAHTHTHAQDWGSELFEALKGAGGRAYSNYAVGYNNVQVPEATARGIPVGNTPGGGACARLCAFVRMKPAAWRLPWGP
jgi:hypothetical protein